MAMRCGFYLATVVCICGLGSQSNIKIRQCTKWIPVWQRGAAAAILGLCRCRGAFLLSVRHLHANTSKSRNKVEFACRLYNCSPTAFRWHYCMSLLGVSGMASAKTASAIDVRFDDVGVDTEIPYWLPFWREFCWVLQVRVAFGVDTEFPYRVRVVDRGGWLLFADTVSDSQISGDLLKLMACNQ